MAYTAFDRFVARLRFRAVRPYIHKGARVCDLGCGLDARFFQWLGSRIRLGVGIDYQWSPSPNGVSVILADISRRLPMRGAQFDHVVMLAVLEHLAEPDDVLR